MNHKTTYIGSTSDLRRRLKEHNEGAEISTKRYKPWRLVSYEAYQSEEDAREREKKLKHHGNSVKQLRHRSRRSFKNGAKEGLPSTISSTPKNGAGFTLIELLVVIAIIGILSSVVLASLNSARTKSRDVRRIADFKQIQLAVELFYDSQGRYPQSPGHATWSGHWAYFSECLEAGTNCGFSVSNYTPAISKVPQDPSRTTSDPFANDVTYYPAYPTGCSDGQSYRLAVSLETDRFALDSDLDGSFYNNNDGCEDSPNYWYCVGVGTCSGW